jgi:hypothetical protein
MSIRGKIENNLILALFLPENCKNCDKITLKKYVPE